MTHTNFPDLGPRFVIVEKLDEGGMATIYLGKDTELDRDVAIKLLKFTSETDAAQIRGEAQIMLRLQHPNIVRVLDVGKSRDNAPFIVMERLRGRNLARYLQDLAEHRLPLRQGLEFARQLCRALIFADSHKIYHRDISARNIFVCDTGELKLLDFGTSRVREATMTVTSESPRNNIAVTLAYAAPEVFDAGYPLSDRLRDIYAFGVVLYEMFTGQRPFHAPADHVLVARILHATPIAPRVHAPLLPRSLQRVILTAMARNPKVRHRSFAALLEDLDRVNESLTRTQLVLLGTAILGLLILGYIAGSFNGRGVREPSPRPEEASLTAMPPQAPGPVAVDDGDRQPVQRAVLDGPGEPQPEPQPEPEQHAAPGLGPKIEAGIESTPGVEPEPGPGKPTIPSQQRIRQKGLVARAKQPIRSVQGCLFALNGAPPFSAVARVTIDAQGNCTSLTRASGHASTKMLECAKRALCAEKFSAAEKATTHSIQLLFSE